MPVKIDIEEAALKKTLIFLAGNIFLEFSVSLGKDIIEAKKRKFDVDDSDKSNYRLVCVHPIKKGEVIFVENALFTFGGLDGDSAGIVYGHLIVQQPWISNFEQIIIALYPRTVTEEYKEKSQEYIKRGYDSKSANTITKVMLTMLHNFFVQPINEVRWHCLYHISSFLNHSCDPNITAIIDTDFTMTMTAIRDIEPGEELCHSYTPRLSTLPREERRAIISKSVIKDCKCRKCESGL